MAEVTQADREAVKAQEPLCPACYPQNENEFAGAMHTCGKDSE